MAAPNPFGDLESTLRADKNVKLLEANEIGVDWIDEVLATAAPIVALSSRYLFAREASDLRSLAIEQVIDGGQNKILASVTALLTHLEVAPVIPEGATAEVAGAKRNKWKQTAIAYKNNVLTAIDLLKTSLIQYNVLGDSNRAETARILETQRSDAMASTERLKVLEAQSKLLVGVLQNAANSKHFSDVVAELRTERSRWLTVIGVVVATAVAGLLLAEPPTAELAPWILRHAPFGALIGFIEWIAVTQFSQVTKQLRDYRLKQAISLEIERSELTGGVAEGRVNFQRERLALLLGAKADATGSDAPVEDLVRVIAAAKPGT